MSLKYKSPLIRSKNTSATSDGSSPSDGKPAQQADKTLMGYKLSNNLVYDNSPQHSSHVTPHRRGRGCSSPRFNSPRPRGTPYQWTSPNQMNDSWSSSFNSPGNYSPQVQNSYSPHRPQFNKYKKQNFNNYENSNENYFHPSMLEDPWETLVTSSENYTETE